MISTPDGEIFTITLGRRSSATPLLVLHGFPTSSWDFAEVAHELATEREVCLFDFLGFGFSEKPARAAYSLFEQADVTILVARALGVARAHVWAHDMGTSVATELLARRERGLLPFEIASLALMNGSMHMTMASPTLGQRILKSPAGPAFARVANKTVFTRQIARVFARPPGKDTLDGMWELASREEGTLRFPAIVRYMSDRVRFERRWIDALSRFDGPVLVAWGERDPVARLPIAERLARETPSAELVTFPELGHYPQVEDPHRVAATLAQFLRR